MRPAAQRHEPRYTDRVPQPTRKQSIAVAAATGVELSWLRGLLEARPPAEREDFIAAVLLNAGFDVDDLSPALEALLERFAVRADLTPGSPTNVNRQIAEYFALHPLSADLVEAFEARFRADLLAQDPEAFKAVMLQLGQQAAAWQPREEPAAGRHRGGALGFFAARAKFDGR